MQYCPISLLFSLPAVASDSPLTTAANWATIIGLFASIRAICVAKKAFNAQKEALEQQIKDSKQSAIDTENARLLQQRSLDKQIEDSKTADENTKIALAKQDEMIEHQQVLGAWSLLAQKGTGDLGRKDALEFLHSKGKSLAGLDLSNAHLVGLDLREDLMGGVKKASLCGAIFNGANLDYAMFDGANLTGAHFQRSASLNFTSFEDANLTMARFYGANFNGTHFDGANFNGTHFERANLRMVSFMNMWLTSVFFEGANLDQVIFQGATLFNCDTSKIFNGCYIITNSDRHLPTAPKDPEGYEFVFETDAGTQKTEVVGGETRYYIKLIKTLTKNP